MLQNSVMFFILKIFNQLKVIMLLLRSKWNGFKCFLLFSIDIIPRSFARNSIWEPQFNETMYFVKKSVVDKFYECTETSHCLAFAESDA